MDSNKKNLTIADAEAKYMSVSEFQHTLKLGTYQYARQIVVTGRYNLDTITIFDRTYISRESVAKAIEIRKHTKEEAAS
jgi:hypothetical protein